MTITQNADVISLSYDEVREMLPVRRVHSHKGDYGKVLLISGSDNTVGACILCGRMILTAGAGLLTIMSVPEVVRTAHQVLPEAMTITLNEADLDSQLSDLDLSRFNLIVMGPGLGRSQNTEKLLQYVLKSDKDVILDADGLFYLGRNLDLLQRENCTVITPHLIEYQRIFEYHSDTIREDLKRITQQYPTLTIVLKSENTLIAHQGELIINRVGNNALAKGGSGDVLTGVIGGLYAPQHKWETIPAAVYIHSLAADRWLENHSAYSLLASDLISQIEKVLFEMSRNRK